MKDLNFNAKVYENIINGIQASNYFLDLKGREDFFYVEDNSIFLDSRCFETIRNDDLATIFPEDELTEGLYSAVFHTTGKVMRYSTMEEILEEVALELQKAFNQDYLRAY